MDSITGGSRAPDESSENRWKRFAFFTVASVVLLMVIMFFVGQLVGASGPQKQIEQLQGQVNNLTYENKKLVGQLSDAQVTKDQFYAEINRLRRQLKARTSHKPVRKPVFQH